MLVCSSGVITEIPDILLGVASSIVLNADATAFNDHIIVGNHTASEAGRALLVAQSGSTLVHGFGKVQVQALGLGDLGLEYEKQ